MGDNMKQKKLYTIKINTTDGLGFTLKNCENKLTKNHLLEDFYIMVDNNTKEETMIITRNICSAICTEQ